MDNQITKPEEFLIQRIAVLALATMLALLLGTFAVHILRTSDPYVKSVLSLKGDPIQGHAIFLINCAGCHGVSASGLVGPSLQAVSKRKSQYDLIHQVVSGDTPPMPQFQPNIQEMADLLSYLETL